MAIVSSEILEDSGQIDARRMVRERHVDHVGAEYFYSYMAESGTDADAVLAARAAWLPDYLAQQEIDANMQEAEE